jgi:outer membrane lipopolysaccharide assembly protein LptE/RlpB
MRNVSFASQVSSFGLRTRKPKVKSRNPFVGLGLIVLMAGGCGYQFSGKGEAFPKDVRTVFVEPFINKSRDVGIEIEVTSALRSELHRRGDLVVVDRPEEADATLSGVVRGLGSRVVSVNRHDEALQYEAALVVDATFRRRNPDEILWRTQGFSLTELYSGSRGAVVTSSSDFKTRNLNTADVGQFTDIQLTETLNQEAKDRLVERLARELHQRILEMF